MSLSQYVIICKGKIDFATVKTVPEKIRALSDAATNLVSHIDIQHPGELTDEDIKPISDLQHELMDHAAGMKLKQVEAHGVTMFGLLDALEDKFKQA